MRVARHVHRHAHHRLREIGSVIEIEPAQKILIRLPLPAVLRRDHAGDRLEDFSGTHHRTHIELLSGDRALTGGLGDADQIFGRILDIREVDERALAGNRHFGVHREVHHGIDHDRRRRDIDVVMHDRREVNQREDQLIPSRRHAVEHIVASRSGGRLFLHAAGHRPQLHENARERSPAVVGHTSVHAPRRGRLRERHGRQKAKQNRTKKPIHASRYSTRHGCDWIGARHVCRARASVGGAH